MDTDRYVVLRGNIRQQQKQRVIGWSRLVRRGRRKMLRGHLTKARSARGENGLSAFFEIFLYLGARISSPRRPHDHRMQRPSAPKQINLAGISLRASQQLLEVEPVRVSQRKR